MTIAAWADDAGMTSAPPEAVQYAKDWPLPNQDYSNSRAAMTSTINSNNINSMGVAWSFKIPGIGSVGGATSNPLIINDTVYFQDLRANIFALDLKSGMTSWERRFNTTVEGPNGPAAGYGKIFAATDPHSMTALNASDGKELWSMNLSTINTTGIDIQPTVYDGMVYASTVPGAGDLFYAPGGIGVIYALDQATGRVVWSFSTVDSPDLWGHPEVNSGGGCWYTPAVDTRTGLTFWGTGNPAPFPGTEKWPNGSSRPGPNLYTDSILALDCRSGSLRWYTQVSPHDLFDFDFQIPPILASANISGEQQEIVIGAGKMGRVYAFNRSTGAIQWVVEVGEHNGNDQLDVLPQGVTRVRPSPFGGVETPMAYADGVVYVPVLDWYGDWTPTGIHASSLNITQASGELVAINVSRGKILWHHKLGSMVFGAATVVNDLVFTATFDGNIYAFKRDTGERVWKYTAPAGINGWPAVAGDTIIWPAGVGNASLVALRPDKSITTPQMMIVRPAEGAVLRSNNVTVSVGVRNLNLTNNMSKANVTGEGHIHYFMDTTVPVARDKPAFTSSGIWAMTDSTTYTWKNVSEGMHNFSAELVNNDHTPLHPPVTDSINVIVTEEK